MSKYLDSAASEDRCEMCGGVKTSCGVDCRPPAPAAEALRRMADVWLQDRLSVEIILCRVVFPDMSYAQIGKMCGGVSRQRIDQKLRQIESAFPHIGAFCRDQSAYATAQRRKSP